jgi:hypothetical protein
MKTTLQPDPNLKHGFWMYTRWLRRPYFVQDAYLRPVRDGRAVPYDPFVGYTHDYHPKEGPPIYLELQELDLENEAAIGAFATKWGLLGVFQDGLVQTRARVRGQGWFVISPDAEIDYANLDKSEARQEATVILETDRGEYTELPFTEYYPRYFPDLRFAPEELPQPFLLLEEAGWDYLCEPLDEFVRKVTELKDVIQRAFGEGNALDYAAGRLCTHLRRVHLYVAPEGRQLVRKWAFPSLLSALYAMLMQDATGGRLRECQNARCGKPFVARRKDQEYCSKLCRDATRQRELRLRKLGKENT